MSWRVHPAARHPVRTALVILFMSMIAGALVQTTGTFLYAALAMAVFMAVLVPYFIPTEYTLDDSGITQRRPGRIRHLKWTDIRHVTSGKNRVYVSPSLPRVLRRDPGLLLLCPDNYTTVVDTIEKVRSHQHIRSA